MALNYPVSFTSLLITDSDLGKGFSIDDSTRRPKKSAVYVNRKNLVTPTLIDQSDLRLVHDHQSLNDSFGIGGELKLSYGSYGLISGNVMGDYLNEASSSDNQLTFMYRRKIAMRIVELAPDCPAKESVSSTLDIETLRANFGFHYISKILYGAALEVKITLHSTDKATINSLKGTLSGPVDLGLFKMSVEAHLSSINNSSSSQLRVTSSVTSAGSNLPERTDITTLDQAIGLIREFKVEEESLVPIAIELSEFPPSLTPLFQFPSVVMAQYKTKLKTIGDQYWHFEEMWQRLEVKKIALAPQLQDLVKAPFARDLYTEIAVVQHGIREAQKIGIEFLQNNSVEEIFNKDIPHNATFMAEKEEAVFTLIGLKVSKTTSGEWLGPMVQGMPTHFGKYHYIDGAVYEGFCLAGKREGPGKMTFASGHVEQLLSIEGIWKDNETSFPSVVTYANNAKRSLKDANGCLKWAGEQRAKRVADSVQFKDASHDGEYIKKFGVNLNKIQDEQFLQFVQNVCKEQRNRTSFNLIFMGVTGCGKTTLVEYFINVLTGQVHAAQTLRAQELEVVGKSGKPGQSMTMKVCRYEITYFMNNVPMFSIVLIDTPGFADTNGLDKDQQHVQSILETVSKIDELHGVCYVVPSSLKRATLEPLKVLCNVFSILPKEAFNCVATVVTFSDYKDQAIDVQKILETLLNGISDRPLLFMDNPWSLHISNRFRSKQVSSGKTFGVDNSNTLNTQLANKTDQVFDFVLHFIRSNASFVPVGMAELHQLKKDLFERLAEAGKLVVELRNVLGLIEALNDNDVKALLAQNKSIDLASWCERQGFALVDGKAKAKIVGKIPFDGGVYSTVCFAPNCLNMACHINCSLKITQSKGSEVFVDCLAFEKQVNCNVCPNKCSYKQHIHSLCQLEWIEDDKVARAFFAMKNGFETTRKELQELETEARPLQTAFETAITKLSELRTRFKNLAVLGDIEFIVSSSRETYQQQYEVAIQVDKNKADAFKQIVTQLDSFLLALNESDTEIQHSISSRISEVVTRGKSLMVGLSHMLF